MVCGVCICQANSTYILWVQLVSRNCSTVLVIIEAVLLSLCARRVGSEHSAAKAQSCGLSDHHLSVGLSVGMDFARPGGLNDPYRSLCSRNLSVIV